MDCIVHGVAKSQIRLSNFHFLSWLCLPSLTQSFTADLLSLQKQRHYFANKGLSSQGYGFSSSHVWMLELDQRRLRSRESMLLNCDAGKDS